MDIPKTLLFTSIFLCKFDEYGPHFHIVIPIDDNYCLYVSLTSKVEKYQENIKRFNSEPELLAYNTIKGFECLTCESVVKYASQKRCTVDELRGKKYFTVLSKTICPEFQKKILENICASPNVRPTDKKAIINKYFKDKNK